MGRKESDNKRVISRTRNWFKQPIVQHLDGTYFAFEIMCFKLFACTLPLL